VAIHWALIMASRFLVIRLMRRVSHVDCVTLADSVKRVFCWLDCLTQRTINPMLTEDNEINLQIAHIYLAKVFENNVKSAPFCKND
jgi:hypothetical protein